MNGTSVFQCKMQKELLQKARTFGEPFYLAVVLGVIVRTAKAKRVVSLKWSDIDFIRGTLNLRSETTKSKKHRLNPSIRIRYTSCC
jgi:integrase